ncbi:MAG: bifunctional (p)ppGpp synthetase/guanosine-3',5'-bis(diphosphate) 3'-pyrophosphohydrolase [Pseudomonadota bacterium]
MAESIASLETELPEDKLLRQLCSIVSTYMELEQVDEICRAYRFGANAHRGQSRMSGEAYICHPLSVAIILAEMHMDAKGVIAAVLHDVIEDTRITKKALGEAFSVEIAELVDGVSKLTQIDSRSRAEAQAENVRKMFLAMARDLRVILVKLADRLHNMRTLGVMPAIKKRRIARETLEIYAPIANRLGMNSIRHELQELGFSALYPMRYRILQNVVKKARGNRKEVLEKIKTSLKKRLLEAGLLCDVVGREKHVYSIYQKMSGKHISFSEVLDVYAFRIFTDKVDSCYRALGVMHNLYKPVPGRFKDYIALPKANGYQSLHTVLVGPYGIPVEIQIRTHEMHRMSESGIAAHWLYKTEEQRSSSQTHANEWLRDLLEIQKSAGDPLEFIENLKVDLFPQEVFVFTPKGSIVKVPKGATVVDFAYGVHTDIGNACVSARVDRRLVSLQTKLENGQSVEIITAEWARPSPLWLNFVVTAKARAGIRAYLRNFKKQEAIKLGRRLLDKELLAQGSSLESIPGTNLVAVLGAMGFSGLDDLLEDIGLGNRMPFLVAKHLCQEEGSSAIKLDENDRGLTPPLAIKGTEGMVVNLAKCCRPIPGDAIVGFFNPGKGLVVHHAECKNGGELRKKQASWLDVEWDPHAVGEFSVELRLEVLNQRGTLATVASTISRMEANIENVAVREQDARVSVDVITLSVRDRVHLARIIRALKKLYSVLKITRVKA